MITYFREPLLPDSLTRQDRNLWRGPCGAWHYRKRRCRVCTLLAKRERER